MRVSISRTESSSSPNSPLVIRALISRISRSRWPGAKRGSMSASSIAMTRSTRSRLSSIGLGFAGSGIFHQLSANKAGFGYLQLRAPHHMPGAAGSLRRRGRRGRKWMVKRAPTRAAQTAAHAKSPAPSSGRPRGARMRLRLGLRRARCDWIGVAAFSSGASSSSIVALRWESQGSSRLEACPLERLTDWRRPVRRPSEDPQ